MRDDRISLPAERREADTLLEGLADATLAGTRKDYLSELATVPLLIIDDDVGMRKLPHTAAARASCHSECGAVLLRQPEA